MQPASATTLDVRPQIDAANLRFSERFNAGDFEGAALGVYTADARVLPPGAAAIAGRAEIAAFWRAAAEALGITEVRLTTLEYDVHGETAHEIGRAELKVAGGTQEAVGKYVVIWKREDGEWRWDVDIWNMDA